MASSLQSIRSSEGRLGRRDPQAPSNSPLGLDWNEIVSGLQENWEHIEQDVRQAQQPARPSTEEEPVRQQATDLQRREVRKQPVEESKAPVAVEAAAPTPSPLLESAQAALNFRAPELPRQEGPAPFVAVPNHSAGASGFGSTWSHAAKLDQGPSSIVMAE